MTDEPSLDFVDEKYGRIVVYSDYSQQRGIHEWTVFMKSPVHLYDIVDYTPAGKHTTRHSDGRVEEGWHDEYVGQRVWEYPRNWRLDFECEEPPTKEAVVQAIDEDIKDSIENYDGVVTFEKIIGVK